MTTLDISAVISTGFHIPHRPTLHLSTRLLLSFALLVPLTRLHYIPIACQQPSNDALGDITEPTDQALVMTQRTGQCNQHTKPWPSHL
jgi:hypothetical protein